MEIKTGRDWVCPYCKNFNKDSIGNRCQVCEREFSNNETSDAKKKILQAETPRKPVIETPRRITSETPKKVVIETPKKDVREIPKKPVRRIPAVDKEKPTKYLRDSKVDSRTDLFTESINKKFKVFKRIMIACLIIALVIVAVSVVSNASSDVILEECDNIFASVMETFESGHFVADEQGTEVFEPFYKIVERINCISQQLKDSSGREYLLEILGW